jgi:hypothetical protein
MGTAADKVTFFEPAFKSPKDEVILETVTRPGDPAATVTLPPPIITPVVEAAEDEETSRLVVVTVPPLVTIPPFRIRLVVVTEPFITVPPSRIREVVVTEFPYTSRSPAVTVKS